MKIYIPHLHYTILVKEFKSAPVGLHAQAYTKRVDKNTCEIYLPKKKMPPATAHEVMHAIQYICEARNIDFIHEMECTAYLMQYILGKILGYSYED